MENLDRLDESVVVWFQAHRTDALDQVVLNVTDLGSQTILLLAAIAAVLVFLCLRQWRTALALAATMATTWGLVEEVKYLVQRARPHDIRRVAKPSLLTELSDAIRRQLYGAAPEVPSSPGGAAGPSPSYSFPSSHAANSATIYVLIALVSARRLTRPWLRAVVIGGSLVLVLVIGVTQLYLGAHYLTDVLGGWSLGLGFAVVGGWLEERWTRKAATSHLV
jgi:undecaprenyl-diphosphatase